MRPEMCAMTTWPFSSCTRNMVLGRVSSTVPSISITSSLAMCPGSERAAGLPRKPRIMPRTPEARKHQQAVARESVLPDGLWPLSPTWGRPHTFREAAHLPKVLIELMLYLLLDRALEHAGHQTELRAHAHAVLADFDPSLHAAASDVQGVAFPTTLDRILAHHSGGNPFDDFARAFAAEIVSPGYVDGRHALFRYAAEAMLQCARSARTVHAHRIRQCCPRTLPQRRCARA